MMTRFRRSLRLATLALTLVAVVASALWPAGAPARAQQDARYFSGTGFRIDDDQIWDYFTKRGGTRTFGLPTSRTFTFLGAPTQFFQRHVVQRAAGGVRTLNLLDDGLLPYTTINGSTFPAADPQISAAAPKPGSADYGDALAKHLERTAPETFEGEPVRFASTFAATVTLADAFPTGGGSPDLLPLLNLELWGQPTSKPARDPKNNNFVYLRFQRGIMHYDAACKCTQGLLLADALKAVITGQNLPDDLALQAAKSPLFKQYDPASHNGPLQPERMDAADLGNAFRPSLDTAPPGPRPAVVASTAPSTDTAEEDEPDAPTASAPAPAAPAATPASSSPPAGDPKPLLVRLNTTGRDAKEAEAKDGADARQTWASARFERPETYRNFRSGPVTIYSKAIIARDLDTARQILAEEAAKNEKFPEAKKKVGATFPFNMAGSEDVGEEAYGIAACTSACDQDEGEIHRRMVFRVENMVGVIYTFGVSHPEGNTQAYTRQYAQQMVRYWRG